MSDLVTLNSWDDEDNENRTPFDHLCHFDEDGEYWSAMELSPVLGYTWEGLKEPIKRAILAISNIGQNGTYHVRKTSVPVATSGNAPNTSKIDYRLTRFGAYMLAMNGVPSKPEIASAQSYFAIKTREAELGIDHMPRTLPAALRAYANSLEEALEAKKRVAELEPKAEEFDEFINTEKLYNWFEVTGLLYNDETKNGRNKLIAKLRELKVIIPNWIVGNARPYQEFLNRGWFEIKVFRHNQGKPTTLTTPAGVSGLYKLLKNAGENVVPEEPKI